MEFMSDMKPRIAFCFSWQCRTLDQTYQIFQKNLFDAAKEQWFNYDVFCAVEDDEDIGKVELLNPTKIEKIKSSEVKKIIDEKWGNFIKSDYVEKYWCYWNGGTMPQMFYKICKSIELKNQYKKEKNISYDIVFRLRFDCPFPRKLNFNNILYKIKDSNRIVVCNRNKMIPAHKFIIKIEDFYFIMDDEASNILWDIFEKRDISFKWFEIKYRKLHKIFVYINKIIDFFWKKMPIFGIIFWLPFSYLYAIFFQPISAEIVTLNYFKNMECKVDTETYITIWFIRDKKKYKRLLFTTHTKKWMFKKWKYEI